MDKVLTFKDAETRYGQIIDGKWGNEGLIMVVWAVPSPISASWINSATGKPTTHIYCNRDIINPLDNAIKDIIAKGLISELKTFDGCFSIRDVRGEKGKPSCHSYGLAIDINAATNRLGTPGDLSPELVKCFTDAGFDWGGNFKRKDPMHFSWAYEGRFA